MSAITEKSRLSKNKFFETTKPSRKEKSALKDSSQKCSNTWKNSQLVKPGVSPIVSTEPVKNTVSPSHREITIPQENKRNGKSTPKKSSKRLKTVESTPPVSSIAVTIENETKEPSRKRKLPSKFAEFDLNGINNTKERPEKKKKIDEKQEMDEPEETQYDPVFKEQFGIHTEVRYSTKVVVARGCVKKAKQCWKNYQNEYSLIDSKTVKKEIQSYEECIKGSSPQGKDKWTEKYDIKYINENVGYGLFAKSDYTRNEVIGFYAGVLTNRVKNKDYAFDWFENPFEGLSTDGSQEGNATRYMNHSPEKTANVTTVEYCMDGLPYVVFVAKRAIKSGEQLCYDYGSGYWEKKGMNPEILS